MFLAENEHDTWETDRKLECTFSMRSLTFFRVHVIAGQRTRFWPCDVDAWPREWLLLQRLAACAAH